MRTRAGIERELVNRADSASIEIVWPCERMDEYCTASRVLIAEVTGGW